MLRNAFENLATESKQTDLINLATALNTAADAIKLAVEALNGKTTTINTEDVGGAVQVTNFPATQTVAGSVSVSNLPAVQDVQGDVSVSGTVAVLNLPAVQEVDGTVVVSNFTDNGLTNQQLRATPVVVKVLNSIITNNYNSIDLTYNAQGDVATVTYKQDGVTVSTLTLSYTNGNLTTVGRVDA